MADYDENWNKKALPAWNKWKAVCSICGCPAEERKILTVEVSRAFRRKLHSVVGDQLDPLFSSEGEETKDKDPEERDVLPSLSGRLPGDPLFYESDGHDDADGEEEIREQLGADDADHDPAGKDASADGSGVLSEAAAVRNDRRFNWAHEFDCGIIEKANSPTSPKNYKDHTWECIRRSDDPPLKIIRGQLLGFQGIINEIAERFLRSNYPQIWEKLTSLQTSLGGEDEDAGTLEDLCEDKSALPPGSSLDDTDEKWLRKCFRDLFTNDNAAIFLIYLTGFSSLFPRKLSLAMPELKDYVGLSSTSPLYERLDNVILPKIRTLPGECLQVMSVPGAGDFLIFLMIAQLEPEKRASSLLQCVRDRMANSKGEENR